MTFLWLKLIHVVALILWLGPATGAYWILLRLNGKLKTPDAVRLERLYEEVLLLEHAAFFSLVLSGYAMTRELGIGLTEPPWQTFLRWRGLFYKVAIPLLALLILGALLTAVFKP